MVRSEMKKRYIDDFVENLNHTGITLDIRNIDHDALKQRLTQDDLNKLWRIDGTDFFSVENCDLQDKTLDDLGDDLYDHVIMTLYQDENGYYINTDETDIFVFDFEVFRYDWLVVFRSARYGVYYEIHNNSRELKDFVTRGNKLFCGFNVKHYDNFIMKAILCGADNKMVKEINDWIIEDKRQGFDHWFIRENKAWFNSFDLKDDMQQGLSLKAIEGHLGMSIEESEVDFNIDRPLTEEELELTFKYCRHDVDATHELMKLRGGYLKTKRNLGKRAGISETKSLAATNAKLTAMMLHAERKEWKDGREYVYPKNLDTAIIPKPVLDFFETIHDKSIPDEKLFKTSLEIEIGGMPCKYAWGGVHGSLTGYHEKATEHRVIQNRDVSSLYPSLIEIYNYLSRNVPDPELFYAIKRDRIQAKHKGDKQTAKDLKLPLNTVSGAQENRYNDLYDPLPTRSMRISGQLFLTILTVRLLRACKTIRLLNLNTDGLMYSVDVSELALVDEIAHAWEAETRFELEVDEVREVWIKDVNNLLMIKTDGEVKTVGGYLNYGVSEKGAWSINNNATIVKKALVAYFVHGTPVADTINGSTDIFDFQLIAKAGATYREVYHTVDGKRIPVQKVNRVYATADERYGTLHKVKEETGEVEKIASLPDHCIIDNGNRLSVTDIDKTYYIEFAEKCINDFLGIKEEKQPKKGKVSKMATKKNSPEEVVDALKEQMDKPANEATFLQKLFTLQSLMDKYTWEKDGKNMHQQYKYITEAQYKKNFKVARREAGLLWECECVSHEFIPAVSDKMHLIISDFVGRLTDPESGDYREYRFSGSGADNGDKALYKAYTGGLKFFLADQYLVAEGNDPENDEDDEAPTAPAPKPAAKPKTTGERAAIKAELTDKDGKASKLQLDTLKKSLKKLREADPEQEDFITAVAERTENFTNATKEQCEKLILKIGQMIDDAKSEDDE